MLVFILQNQLKKKKKNLWKVTDLPLVKAEPIRDTASASVKMYLQKGKNAGFVCEWENVRETDLQTPWSVEEEREEG